MLIKKTVKHKMSGRGGMPSVQVTVRYHFEGGAKNGYATFAAAEKAAAKKRAAKAVKANPLHDRPMAARGLVSYRYKTQWGWIMIGARDDREALREVRAQPTGRPAKRELLEVWDGEKYKKVAAKKASKKANPVRKSSAGKRKAGSARARRPKVCW